MKKTAMAAAFVFLSASAYSALALDPVNTTKEAEGRFDFGWRGDGGGNLEAYSKTATANNGGKKGQFKFIFGGAPNLGAITFNHYDGAGNWPDVVKIYPNGDLTMKGKLTSSSIEVVASPTFPDYVFKDDYKLMSIEDLSKHIQENGHLPGIPTAEEVRENGLDLGMMSVKTMEKVEELALYVIQLKKDNDALKTEVEQLRQKLDGSR